MTFWHIALPHQVFCQLIEQDFHQQLAQWPAVGRALNMLPNHTTIKMPLFNFARISQISPASSMRFRERPKRMSQLTRSMNFSRAGLIRIQSCCRFSLVPACSDTGKVPGCLGSSFVMGFMTLVAGFVADRITLSFTARYAYPPHLRRHLAHYGVRPYGQKKPRQFPARAKLRILFI